MSRTARYKLQYVAVIAISMASVCVVVWSLRPQPLVLLGVAALALIPGRVSGLIWRDLYLGRRHCEAGEFDAAVRCLERIIALLSERPDLRGLWWLAWAVYSRDPLAMALNNLGAAQLGLGRLDDAESSLHAASTADPQYPIPHYNLAVLSTVRGDTLAAQEHATHAIKLGYAGAVSDRILQAAGTVLARIEGRAM